MNKDLLPISMDTLTEDWRRWSSDYSLQKALRFGQYVLNKRLTRGAAWPECFYADTSDAWKLLSDWINNRHIKNPPRILFH